MPGTSHAPDPGDDEYWWYCYYRDTVYTNGRDGEIGGLPCRRAACQAREQWIMGRYAGGR